MNKTTILISGMEFYAYHGCFEEEQAIGTRFVVDLSLSYDAQNAINSDNVDDAVNYQLVYKTIQEIMDKPKHLLETVANDIIKSVKSRFPVISSVSVTVKKLNPPLDGKTEFVAVQLQD